MHKVCRHQQQLRALFIWFNTIVIVGGEWNPHKVEMAVWTYYVLRELKPQVLDDFPDADSGSDKRVSGDSVTEAVTENGVNGEVSSNGESVTENGDNTETPCNGDDNAPDKVSPEPATEPVSESQPATEPVSESQPSSEPVSESQPAVEPVPETNGSSDPSPVVADVADKEPAVEPAQSEVCLEKPVSCLLDLSFHSS